MRGLLLVAACLATPLTGQARYRFTPRDTIRYHEVTEGKSDLQAPRGPVTITTRHDATIALVQDRADTLKAWFEQLALTSVNPRGESRPATDSALRLPFRIAVTPRGRVTTAAAPTFPAEIASHSDLTREFEDLFISLPAGGLRPNVEWADTVQYDTAREAQDTTQSRHIRRYRVLRDTVVDGVSAVVIAVNQDVTFRSWSPMQNMQAVIDSRLTGSEEGTAVFAPGVGRLLARVRRGHLTGAQVLRGEGRELTIPMTYDYTSSFFVQR